MKLVNFEPAVGDVVRDKESGADYVIQSVVIAGGVGFSVFYGLHLIDDSIKQFNMTHQGALLETIPVWINKRHLSVEQIQKIARRADEKFSKLDKVVKSYLRSGDETYAVLRDLTMIIERSDEDQINEGLIKIARIIVEGGAPLNPSAMRQAIKSTVSEEMHPEFLDYLVNRISKLMRKQGAQLDVSAELQGATAPFGAYFKDAMLLAEMGFGTTPLKADDSFNPNPVTKFFKETFLSSDRTGYKANIEYEAHPFFASSAKAIGPENRFHELVKTMVMNQGGSWSEVGENYARKWVPEVRKSADGGLFLQNFIRHTGIGPAIEQVEVASQLSTKDHIYASTTSSKASAVTNLRSRASARGGVSLGTLASIPDFDVSDSRRKLYSVDINTFVDDWLRAKTFTYKGMTGSLVGDEPLRAALVKDIRAGSRLAASVYLTPDDIKKLNTALKNNRVPDITSIIETSTNIQSTIQDSQVGLISAGHGAIVADGVFQYNQARVVGATISREELEAAKLGRIATPTVPTASEGNALLFWGSDKSTSETYYSKSLKAIEDLGITGSSVHYLEMTKKQLGNVGFLPVSGRNLPKELKELLTEQVLAGANQVTKRAANNTVSGVEAVRQGSYRINKAREEGQAEAMMAFASLRKKDGRPIILASEVRIPLSEQLLRAKKYYKQGGGLLDIETRERTTEQGSEQFLTNLNLRVAGRTVFERAGLGEDVGAEADALVDLATAIQNSGDEFVIGTQTAYDFDNLRDRAARLSRDSRLLPETQEALARASATYQETAKKKLFGAEVVLGVARPALSLSQAVHTLDAFGRMERHISGQDTADLYELLEKYKPHFLSEVDNAQLQVSKLNTVFFGADRAHSQGGNAFVLHELKPLMAEDKAKVAAIYEPVEITAKGGIVRSGMFHSMEGSPYELRALLEGMQILGSTEEAKDAFSLQKSIIADKSERYVRSLNPLTRNFYDTLGTYAPGEHGVFAHREVQTWQLVKEMLPQALKLRQAQSGVDRLSSVSSLVDQALEMGNVDQRISDMLTAGESEATAAMLKGRIHHGLVGVLTDQSEMRARFGEGSLFGRMLDSPIASFLGDSYKESGISSENRYLARAAALRAAAVENELIRSEYITNPRFSLNMGAARVSMNFTNNVFDADRVSKAIDRVTAEAVLHTGHDWRTRKLLETIGVVSPEESEALQQATSEYLGFPGRNEWYEKIQMLSGKAAFQEGGKFGIITDTIQKLRNSKYTQELTAQAFRTKGDRFGEGTAERVMSETVASEVESAASRTGNIYEAVSSALAKYSYKPEGADSQVLLSLLRDKITDQVDHSKLMDWATDDKLSEVGAEADRLLTGIYNKGFVEGEFGSSKHAVTLAFMRARDVAEKLRFDGGTEAEQITAQISFLRDAAERGVDKMTEAERAKIFWWERQNQIAQESEAIRGSWLKAVNKASAAWNAQAGQKVDAMLQHKEFMAGGAPIPGMVNVLRNLNMPLMAIGGIAGLALASPPQDDSFSAGQRSDAGETHISKYAEIPGNTVNTRVWIGNTDPFKMDISFRGFVNGKHQQDELVHQVYNILNGHMEFQEVNTDIRDERLRSHKQSARDLLERVM